MCGIYIHIPFCRLTCSYCDFHFSTTTTRQDEMIEAICQELILRQNYIQEKVKTIYFGGGTPSLLNHHQLELIFKTLNQYFDLDENLEITLEANPEDLTSSKLEILFQSPINRLSIGIQSLRDNILRFFNRNHDAQTAYNSILSTQKIGFENFNIDLIFGLPNLSFHLFLEDLEKLIALDIPHFSIYGLTIEPKTVLYHLTTIKQFHVLPDEIFAQQYRCIFEFLEHYNYESYEISNYTSGKHYALHNMNYWFEKPYLGVGPSAHSYNKFSRQANISNNNLYLKALTNNELPAQVEILALHQKINEYLMTTLRTKWGYDNAYVKKVYNYDIFNSQPQILETFEKKGLINITDQIIILSLKGRLLVDDITMNLFLDENHLIQ